MQFGPTTFGIIGILGMVGGATGCHSSIPAAGSTTFSSLEQVDKYQWLEDVAGPRSMTWVKEQNARTTKALESDPRFAGLKEAALKVYESPDHLAIPVLKKGTVYNTWQDAQHVRGILRRTTLAGYLSPDPH
jgi:prolyl oligopeptidase